MRSLVNTTCKAALLIVIVPLRTALCVGEPLRFDLSRLIVSAGHGGFTEF